MVLSARAARVSVKKLRRERAPSAISSSELSGPRHSCTASCRRWRNREARISAGTSYNLISLPQVVLSGSRTEEGAAHEPHWGFLHIPPKRCIRLLPPSARSGAGLTPPPSHPDRSGQGFW